MKAKQPKSLDQLTVSVRAGEDKDFASAKAVLGPHVTNAFALAKFGAGAIGNIALDHAVLAMRESAARVHANDMRDVEAMLSSQATALNVMFGEMTRRAGINLTEYPMAADRYFRMAMKAQNQCRMTLETLANVKNPPTIFAKQANIANGSQQVNNGVAGAGARAAKSINRPDKLLEQGNGERLDTGTQGGAGSGNQPVEAMVTVDGTKDA